MTRPARSQDIAITTGIFLGLLVTPPNIIVLAIDRLHAAYLGCYGNTWVPTPTIDRFASESITFDRATIDSPKLDSLYRSIWSRRHAVGHSRPGVDDTAFFRSMSGAGIPATLITDDPAISNHSLAAEFHERIEVPAASRGDLPSDAEVAAEIESTEAAKFYAESIAWLDRAPSEPFCLWLHTSSLGRVWDAPMEFRSQFHDVDDPPAEAWATAPNKLLPRDVDPDEILGIRHAYAGQVAMLDQLTGTLLEAIDQNSWASDALVLILSTRGFPLGEHARVGQCDDALYAELTHIPCIMRLPQNVAASQRFASLVQPADLGATLIDAVGPLQSPAPQRVTGDGRSLLPLVRGEVDCEIDRAITIADKHQYRIETAAWALRHSVDAENSAAPAADSESAANVELFAKPDDWFEVNEIASRCPEIVEQLQVTYREFAARSAAGDPQSTESLPTELIHGEL